MTPRYQTATRPNHALNRASNRPRGPLRAPLSICGSGQYAESIGSSENATNRLTSTAQAMVSAKGLNHCPEMPGMKAIGTNTETMEKVVAATARPISLVPSRAACRWPLPISMWRTMFSRTTIASSMRMPIASVSPSRLIVLSV